MKSLFRSRGIWAYAIAAGGGLVGLTLAHRLFFPLKKLAHWDEIYRYLYPGIDQFRYTLSDLFAAINNFVDNGQLIVVSLRLIRNFFPQDHQVALLVYKSLLLLLTVGVITWFVRTSFKHGSEGLEWLSVFTVALFLLAPATWIQANEVMPEPATLPFFLTWIALSARLLEWEGMNKGERLRHVVFFVLCASFFLLVSYQFLLSVMVMTFGAHFFWRLTRREWPGMRRAVFLWLKLFSFSGVTAVLFWFLLHQGAPLLEKVYFFVRPLGVSNQDFSFTALNMTRWDRYLFGLRNFGWLYFPGWFLLVPSFWVLTREYRRFSPRIQYLLHVSALAVVMAPLAFYGNLRPRYFHLSNTFLLFVVSLGLFIFLKRLWPLRSWGRIALILLLSLYSFFEYEPLYRALPSLANLTAYGTYAGDKGNADEASSFFSLIRRRKVVSFPQLDYDIYFPHRRNVDTEPHCSTLTARLQLALRPGLAPVVPDEMEYFNMSTANLLYLEKFGSYPPPLRRGRPALYLRLSYPEGSPYNSVYYSTSDVVHSDARSEELWNQALGDRTHEILLEERTSDYTLLIAQADYQSRATSSLDWNDPKSLKDWIINRIDHYGNLGWKGEAVKWVLQKF